MKKTLGLTSLPEGEGKPREGAEREISQLVQRLAEAEAAIAAMTASKVDAVLQPGEPSFVLLREAQQALLDSEARAQAHAALLDALLHSAPDIIAYIDADYRIRFVNMDGAEFKRDASLGADWLTLVDAAYREPLRRVFDSVIESGKPASYESPGQSQDGRPVWYSRRLGPVRRDGKVVGVVVISRDITENKQTEAQLIASDRMASVGTLAAGVAHEINNPLAAVIANLDLAIEDLKILGERTAIPSELKDELTDARKAADHVRLIVRDLRIFSRSERDTLEPVDVERVMESTLRMAWNEIRHRARLVKDYGGPPPVEGNESRLAQLFLNLLVNAAQAIPEGDFDHHVIRVSTSCDAAGRVVVKIADTGCGMSPDVQKRLFTPFFTTKPVGSGTGLGLAISQRIALSLAGEITFESEVGKGTEFRVSLPSARFQIAADAKSSAEPLKTPRRGRVLVVDDEPVVAAAAKRILATEHDVTAVNSGAAALELLRQGNHFDVILCDVMMPQMAGMDFYAALQQLDRHRNTPVVFMTGGVFTARTRAFLDSVSHKSVAKPFDIPGLKALVNEVLATAPLSG